MTTSTVVEPVRAFVPAPLPPSPPVQWTPALRRRFHTAQALLTLVDKDRKRIATIGRASTSALAVHAALQRRPLASAAVLMRATGLTAATVHKSLKHLRTLKIVTELTKRPRGRVFSYRRYVQLLTDEPSP